MLNNYLKIALRNIKRHKGYSIINISGLAIGMACCILILMYVTDELSYDKFHEKSDRIYRINAISSIGTTSRLYAFVPPPLAKGLAESIPEIEAFTRLMQQDGMQGQVDGVNVELTDSFFVDADFFNIFTYEFVEGNPQTAIENPDSIVITEETAARIFGDESPMGKTIDLGRDRLIQITGVIKNVPKNSHLQFNAVMPLSFIRDQEGNPADFSQANYFCEWYEYLLIREGTDIDELEVKMAAVVEEKWGDIYRERGTTRQYPLVNIKDLHLHSKAMHELNPPGDINTVYLFSAIALFVLFIACFNFINLSTARSASRGREVGMRKVLGSQKTQIIRQFLSESIIMSIFGLFLGLLIVMLAIPAFNGLAGKQFNAGQLLSSTVLIGLLGIIVVTGIFAGSFPAFILSSFDPVMVLKGKLSSASKNSVMRKVLVGVQFSISIFMIIGIMVIVRQLDYMKNKNLGFNKDQMVVIPFFSNTQEEEGASRNNALKNKFSQNPSIVSASFSIEIPGGDLGSDAFLPEGRDNNESIRALRFWVGHNYIKTYEMEIVLGRDFSDTYSTDADQALIVNETAVKMLGWGQDVLGKRLVNVSRDNRQGVIIGVVKDFHSEGMKMELRPAVLALEPRFSANISVRIRPENVPDTLAYLETSLREIYPDREFTFNYSFIDDNFRNKYPEEEKIREIYIAFGALTIFVACLGLFGLASFSVQQRTKEIGVRKVLGASVREIVLLLSKEFTKWILAANLLAWPLAYLMLNKWLENFAYRINIKWDIFIFSGVLTAVIALFTVSFHSLRAAKSNPVDALKYE
ncbi:MAG: ABC transporter permease [Candidatus Aminicenantes bacterium]|nr:ABC transporter permease [Candidatus Aminicenantes bacterium]